MQTELFESKAPALELLDVPDATIHYMHQFLTDAVGRQLYQKLQQNLAWHQGEIKVYGKRHKMPRLQAWYGDPTAHYQYSNTALAPVPWDHDLLTLKHQVERLCETSFNSVLANWYRDGADGMGFHADNEPELGQQPTIASVSLGEVRNFDLKHKHTSQKVRLPLAHGSLLVMSGDTQTFWQHGIAKRKQPLAGRINLTFRFIHQST